VERAVAGGAVEARVEVAARARAAAGARAVAVVAATAVGTVAEARVVRAAVGRAWAAAAVARSHDIECEAPVALLHIRADNATTHIYEPTVQSRKLDVVGAGVPRARGRPREGEACNVSEIGYGALRRGARVALTAVEASDLTHAHSASEASLEDEERASTYTDGERIGSHLCECGHHGVGIMAWASWCGHHGVGIMAWAWGRSVCV
jgi:hypothetical protein